VSKGGRATLIKEINLILCTADYKDPLLIFEINYRPKLPLTLSTLLHFVPIQASNKRYKVRIEGVPKRRNLLQKPSGHQTNLKKSPMNTAYLRETRSHYTCYFICIFLRLQKWMLCYEN